MRIPTFLAMVLLACAFSANADHSVGDAEAGAAKAESCADCHNAMISLKDRGKETIIKQIKALQASKKGHPTSLAGLSDDDLADIAAYLDAAE